MNDETVSEADGIDCVKEIYTPIVTDIKPNAIVLPLFLESSPATLSALQKRDLLLRPC